MLEMKMLDVENMRNKNSNLKELENEIDFLMRENDDWKIKYLKLEETVQERAIIDSEIRRVKNQIEDKIIEIDRLNMNLRNAQQEIDHYKSLNYQMENEMGEKDYYENRLEEFDKRLNLNSFLLLYFF